VIATVIQIESCGDPRAVSGSGAMGLFQVMPFHFAAGEEPLAIETNARRGLAYLGRGLELAGGDVDLALAGYNGGHGVIGLPSTAWPTETRRYVMWGTGIFAELQSGSGTSPTLASWLAAGGEMLCRRADSYAAIP
jgi:soluble lytic murein transglycosylase-like protein